MALYNNFFDHVQSMQLFMTTMLLLLLVSHFVLVRFVLNRLLHVDSVRSFFTVISFEFFATDNFGKSMATKNCYAKHRFATHKTNFAKTSTSTMQNARRNVYIEEL